MKTDVKVVRGTTNTLKITVTDAEGKLYNLKNDEKLLFGVKKHQDDPDYIFAKSVTNCVNGVYSVEIEPSDTKKCDCITYYYDVAIQSGDDLYTVIPASAFVVSKNIVKWGCA